MEPLDLEGLLQTVLDLIARKGLDALGALTVLVIGSWVAKRVRNALRTNLGRSRLDPTLVPFAAGLVYWGLMVFVAIAVLTIFGIPTTSFIAVLGAASFALGLAMQGTLSNFSAGVMLLLFRPFSVGNWIEVGSGTAGTVREIGLFSTTLFTGDNVKVIVPNSQVFGQSLKNFSANPTRRIDLIMGVSYDDDLQVAHDTILRVITADERVLDDPAPVVAVHELGDSSVDFVVRPWCATGDYWKLRWHLLRRLKEELEAAGCSIPYPQRDVHLFGTAAATTAEAHADAGAATDGA
jgi:small conductance mechanosensitive channel